MIAFRQSPRFLIVAVLLGILWAGSDEAVAAEEASRPSVYLPEIEAVHERPYADFTQGLVYLEGRLYESTGLYGRSTLTVYDFSDYSVLSRKELSDEHFGEGLAFAGNALIQLTYRVGTGFVYDPRTLELVDQFRYEGEGWGLTYDGSNLIMSNGSHFLFVRNPVNYKIVDTIPVRRLGKRVRHLNELEYIDGLVYANVWRTNTIVMVDPDTGTVVGEVDMQSVTDRYRNDRTVGVLNGIAWNDQSGRLLVTGKNWPHLYEITLKRRDQVD